MALAPERLEASQEDIDGVTTAVLDYIKGYTEGDAERHARAYHPECLKRRLAPDEDDVTAITVITPQMMVEYAASGISVVEDCEFEVIIDDISDDIASVRVYSCKWVDFIHLAKARGEWRLFHVTWHNREKLG
ncbi:MAG: nuclear transport factor 2 family protein [Actinomycetota bacterium]|nr:nuclear transport factor 2 family protein [Actinomycetota bacterium]